MTDPKLISNTQNSHLEHLRLLFSTKAAEIIIASPYLAADIEKFLSEFNFSGIRSLDLITTFKPKDQEQLTKPKQLKAFLDHFSKKYPQVKLKIHIDNTLHGKVYIARSENSSSAIISSANFTQNGVELNHEWGLQINDVNVIETLIEDVFGYLDYPELTKSQISKACMFADQYERDNPDWSDKPNIHSDILETVYGVEDASNAEPQYFLKPIGSSELPVLLEEQNDYSDLHQNLHFSKKKPKGVRKGDVVITVAVGGGALLSYFKVTGGLLSATPEEMLQDSWKERWPYYMEGRNQSQEFSKQWWVYNIQRSIALDEYLKKFPGIPVTSAGGFSLDTLNFGSDKVKITQSFGEFLINKIKSALK